ncbi:MAG TPA: NAD(P)H-hydrate dehydratase [Bacillota bacterium]
MRVALANEMREIDRQTQEKYRMSGDLLMEQAALAALRVIEADWESLAGKKIYVLCGKGNNGGDGLALARLLRGRRAEVTVVLSGQPAEYSGLAAQNLVRVQQYGAPVVVWTAADGSLFRQADLIIDALLGTGAKGAPREQLAELIKLVNSCRRPVYALDLPSGIAADNGQVSATAVQAVKTITFGLPQPGLLLYPGAEYAGEIVVAPLGFPPALLEDAAIKVNVLTPEEAAQMVPRRSPLAHKGTVGHLLVIGGAPGMTGAVTLAALGALRSGCGLVTAALHTPAAWPEKPVEVMATSWQELMVGPKSYRAAVIGPGMTIAAPGREILFRMLEKAEIPLVLDADALNILAENRELLKRFSQPTVLTPHPGEMSRLTGLPVAAIQADRLAVAGSFAREWQVTVVLKGARTIIAAPDGTCYINLTGNSGMATAGMGDVLAGVIGSLICQGMPVFDAAVLGAYLHGRAGDRAALTGGSAGMIARDLIDELPRARQQLVTVPEQVKEFTCLTGMA